MVKDKRHTLDYPLSNFDLHEAIQMLNDKANIKNDDQIKPNTPIEQIFNNKGHCILYHKWKGEKVGHWYTCLRTPDEVFVFDSLANPIDKLCKNMIPFLKNNGIKKIVVNKKKFQNTQKDNNDTAVCGRYGLLLYLLHKLNFSIKDIYKFLEDAKKKFGGYDNAILSLTS